MWRKLQLNLSDTYRDRIEGDSSTNIEASIDSSKLAIEVCTRSKFPKEWAMMQINLGVGYWNRIEIGNWQDAIDIFAIALTTFEGYDSWVISENSSRRLLEDAVSIKEKSIQCSIKINQ